MLSDISVRISDDTLFAVNEVRENSNYIIHTAIPIRVLSLTHEVEDDIFYLSN